MEKKSRSSEYSHSNVHAISHQWVTLGQVQSLLICKHLEFNTHLVKSWELNEIAVNFKQKKTKSSPSRYSSRQTQFSKCFKKKKRQLLKSPHLLPESFGSGRRQKRRTRAEGEVAGLWRRPALQGAVVGARWRRLGEILTRRKFREKPRSERMSHVRGSTACFSGSIEHSCSLICIVLSSTQRTCKEHWTYVRKSSRTARGQQIELWPTRALREVRVH